MDDEKLLAILPVLRREYDEAVRKHPVFPRIASDALCVISEELGELAREINDEHERRSNGKTDPCWRLRALTEAAHVAVTAIRTMETLQQDNIWGD